MCFPLFRTTFCFIIFFFSISFGQKIDNRDNYIPPYNIAKKKLPSIKSNKLEYNKIKTSYKFLSLARNFYFEPKKKKFIPLENTFLSKTQKKSIISASYGNFTSIKLDGNFIKERSDKTQTSIHIYYNSSKNTIPSASLNSDISETYILLSDKRKYKTFYTQNNIKISRETFSWFGIPDKLIFPQQTIDKLNVGQNYNTLNTNSLFNFANKNIKSLKFINNIVFDGQHNTELSIFSQATFKLPIEDEIILLDTSIDYLHSRLGSLDYENIHNVFITKINPYITKTNDNYYVRAGASIFFSNNINEKANPHFFSIHPQLKAYYKIIDNYLILYGETLGGKFQNSYHSFIYRNKYTTPFVKLIPTNQLFKINIGIKGQILDKLSYHFNIMFTTEEDKPLFIHNEALPIEKQPYSYGNSFKVVYDNVDSFVPNFNISYTLKKRIDLKFETFFYSYNLGKVKEVWNLPFLEWKLSANAFIKKRLLLSLMIHHIGQRKDLFSEGLGFVINSEVVRLSSITDAQISMKYKLFSNFHVNLNIDNILNQRTPLWYGYNRRGTRVMLGANFTF